MNKLKVEKLSKNPSRKELQEIQELVKKTFKRDLQLKHIKMYIEQVDSILIIREDNIIKAMLGYIILKKDDRRFKDKPDFKEIVKYIKTKKFIKNRGIASLIKGGGTALLNEMKKFRFDFFTTPKREALGFYLKNGFIKLPIRKTLSMVRYADGSRRVYKEINESDEISIWIEEAYKILTKK